MSLGIECEDERIARDKVTDHRRHLHRTFVHEAVISNATDDLSSRTNRQGKAYFVAINVSAGLYRQILGTLKIAR